MKITFLGATETVTGSKYLLEHNGVKILIDCGLFQGRKDLRLRNWDKLPFDASSIDYVILTHAHIDHSGYIPLLVKNGFKGKIYCSSGTLELCEILLKDSGYLQEEDARRANRYNYSKHHPALPLYTEQDAEDCLKYFYSVGFGLNITLDDGLSFSLAKSGHIIGSAFITLNYGKKCIVFSGDIGRMNDPLMQHPSIIQQADYLLVESTYGDRLHDDINPEILLKKIINDTVARGGSIIIPAFAVGRTTGVLYHLYNLKSKNEIGNIPIFMDSPMAMDATDVLVNHANEHRLPKNLCDLVFKVAKYVRSVDESKAIDNMTVPRIIISASGMATGGRVLHHLKKFVGDAKNTILFSGYQAEGTRGDRMLKGEKEIKIHGEFFTVNAQIECLDNISAHADYNEILQWLGHLSKAPTKVFITHGEKSAANALKQKIEEKFNWNVIVPEYLSSEEL